MGDNRTLAIATLVLGIVVLAISQVFVALHLQPVHPLNGAYGNEAILAFELARTPEDVETVIGEDPPDAVSTAARAKMDFANRVDFGYMACYAWFVAFSCMLAAAARRRSWLLIGVLIGPLAALFDMAENFALLQLTQTDADFFVLLPQLHLRTMQKWELLAVVGALFAAAFVGSGRLLQSMIASAIAALLVLAGAMTLIDPAKFGALLLWSIALVWLWQIGYAALCVWQMRETVVRRNAE
ncbi:MAG TPA: hypothetical protein VFB36_00015 [Nevskiaceae bacterium]|nr:hypothetical protein [Nevskiaceae bacterium]